MNTRLKRLKVNKIRISENFYNPFKHRNVDFRRLKELSFHDAFKFYNLNPFGDADKDGVPNWRDCRPFNPRRHGDLPPEIPVIQYSTDIQPGEVSTDIEAQEQPQQENANWSTSVDVPEIYYATPSEQSQGNMSASNKKSRRKILPKLRKTRTRKVEEWDGLWRLYYRQYKGKWDLYAESPDKEEIFNYASQLKTQPYIAEVWIDKRVPDKMLPLLNRRLTKERVVGKVKDVAERSAQGMTAIDYEALREIQQSLGSYSRGPSIPRYMQVKPSRKQSVFVKTPMTGMPRKRSSVYTPPWLRKRREIQQGVVPREYLSLVRPREKKESKSYFLIVPGKKGIKIVPSRKKLSEEEEEYNLYE